MSPESNQPAPEAALEHGSRILVVDDEPGIQRTAQRILSRHYAVTLASSGREALDILDHRQHDLAIVDVRMPGMTGFELLKNIKAQHPDTEVIIMTGSISNPEEKLIEALRERAFYFINKPFEKAVLETLVQRCLERQRLERENRTYIRDLEKDLERAKAFQRLLRPRSFPRVEGLRGDVCYEPSEQVGGDFYDFFTRGESRFGVLIADVAGHGVTAALFTGMLKAEMHAVSDEWCDPVRLFQRMNDRLVPVTSNQYVTAVLAILDFEAREVRYVSAGHPSFFTADGRAWPSTGVPLGMIAGWRYEASVFPLRSGERLFFYTDGLSEASRTDGEQLGEDHLREAFLATAGLSADEAVRQVVESAKSFAGRKLQDDATAIVLEYS